MEVLRAGTGVLRRPDRVGVPRRERCKMLRSRDLCDGRGEWPRGWAILGRSPLENPLALRVVLQPLVLPLGVTSLFVAAAVCADAVAWLTMAKLVTMVPLHSR